MNIEIVKNPNEILINTIRVKLQDFNAPYWEITHKDKYVFTLKEGDNLIGGMVYTIFGEWLELDYFWVDRESRNKGIGSKILGEVEDFARERGCKRASLNTLNFQAKPFYEKNGYIVVYTQKNYPKTNAKYFMEKEL